jgi:uncharacterized protein (DUF2252 family)
MAADLSRTPNSGLYAQICGDAHLSNFGMFGTPERNLVFDTNDFDETHTGPWEWDVKRLAASLEIAGRANGFSAEDRQGIVLDAARSYREAMAEFAIMRNLEVWYARLDADAVFAAVEKGLGEKLSQRPRKAIAKARTRDSDRALGKLTRLANGTRSIVSYPPLIVPIGELFSRVERLELEAVVRQALRDYSTTLSDSSRALFDRYQLVEVARKVVGVGSVGTRCWIALFLGNDDDDPLFLQIKQAEASVLERFTGRSRYHNHGQRVVAGQKLMQSASDIFLGWTTAPGEDRVKRDYYIRQLSDWKGSLVIEDMFPGGMALYGAVCGWTLARAHARSADRIAIAAYLGKSAVFDDAIAAFARTYADQNDRDYDALVAAVRGGRIAAVRGESN